MPERERTPVATSLPELTLRAMDDRERRYDWSWLMCFYVREWEGKLAAAYKAEGKTLINAHFAWFHYHEICDRVLAKAEQHVERAKAAILDDSRVASAEYAEFLIHGILTAECAREFEYLERAVKKHKLQLFI